MLFSYATVNFHLFYERTADIPISAFLTRSQSRVSDTQLTIEALEHLVEFIIVRFVIQSLLIHLYTLNISGMS